MSKIIANVLAAGAAGLVIVSMAAVASAGPVELAPAALDTVTAGAVGNATASAAAIGTASTASTVTNTLAVKVPYASASAAAAGAGAGAANVAGDAEASVAITYGVNGGQNTASQSSTQRGLAAVLEAGLAVDLTVY